MKLKNLLLAGLTIAAMTACSNNEIDEIVDKGNQTPAEEASMKLYFDFANLKTRADDDKSGGKKEGEKVEWNVEGSKITVVLKYPNKDEDIVIENLSPVTEVTDGSKKFTTASFPVNAGTNVTVYAFINPNNLKIEKGATYEDLTLTDPLLLPSTEKKLDYLTGENGIAAENAFMMSGKATGVKIEGGKEDNVAAISVDRVAAKLDEGTAINNSFETTVTYKNTKDKKVNIKLNAFSYSNLTDNTYALNESKDKSAKANYLQPYFEQGTFPTDNSQDYIWIGKAEKNINYCLDNYGNDKPTRVHYKGKVYLGDEEIKSDFYIRAIYNRDTKATDYYFFRDLAALKTYYEGDATIKALTDETIREDLAMLGINRYTGGTCYYEANIQTTTSTGKTVSIMRNNWYKLNVSKINEIGTPTPAKDPEDKTTKLVVETTINPWTIQVNDFEL